MLSSVELNKTKYGKNLQRTIRRRTKHSKTCKYCEHSRLVMFFEAQPKHYFQMENGACYEREYYYIQALTLTNAALNPLLRKNRVAAQLQDALGFHYRLFHINFMKRRATNSRKSQPQFESSRKLKTQLDILFCPVTFFWSGIAPVCGARARSWNIASFQMGSKLLLTSRGSTAAYSFVDEQKIMQGLHGRWLLPAFKLM